MRGFSHTPRTHSFPQAGENPAFPDFALSKRLGYTSSRPRNSDRKSSIFADAGEVWVTDKMVPELYFIPGGITHLTLNNFAADGASSVNSCFTPCSAHTAIISASQYCTC